MAKISAVNSKNLRRNFPEEYRKFFSQNELVVSTASGFMWAGEYSAYYGGISICQKVPFRVYAGFKPISAKRIVVKKEYRAYHRSKNKFSPFFFQPEENERINNYLNDKFKGKIRKEGGYQISFLSEASSEEGLNLINVVCALISLIICFYYYSLSKKDIQRWQRLKVNQLIDKDRWFRRIFNLALEINAAARERVTSGTNVFVSLLNSRGFPIIYCPEKRFSLEKNQSKDFSFTGERMIDLIEEESLSWYFDFGLIQSGTCRIIAGGGNRSIKKTQQDLDKIKRDDLIKKLLLEETDSFFTHYSKKKSLWLIFMEMFDLISLRILLGFKKIFKYGLSNQTFIDFRDALNQHWHFFKILGLDTPKLDLLAQVLQRRIAKENQLGVGIKIAGLGRGGSLAFAVPKDSLLGKEKILEKEIKDELGPEAHISYLSWIDGVEDGGVKIEQDLKNKIYSPFVSSEKIQVRDYSHSFRAVNRLIARDELEKQVKRIDLVFDQTNNRIYVGGKRLTSKEIKSAKETIKVLHKLMSSGGELENNELKPSSYSANRYDFSGKIALPLKRAVEKELKKDLDLKVRGKIYHYSIRFNPKNLRIWMIDRSL